VAAPCDDLRVSAGHAFGRQRPLALGVEEELLLVDPVTLQLASQSSDVVPRVQARAGEVKHDVYEALVETASPVVADAPAAAGALDALRGALRDTGATVIGCGIHPQGAFADVEHVPQDRYLAIAASMRGLLRRTPTCALHVHVGMADPERAIAACDGLRAHLPLLQALAAHSPYWHGIDSGFASARAQLFRGYPRAIIPPPFGSWDAYEALTDAWVRAGDLADYTYLWWDLRPHPRLGTVEVRAMDAQSRLDSAAGLVALVHALAAACADGVHEADVPPSQVQMESSFRAGRDGTAATLWWRGALRPVAQIAADALEVARPYARELGGEAALEEVERIVREGGGAARMRAAHARGGMRAVLELLAAESARPYPASTQTTSPIRSQR
jgi:glutamate---cysteine ligase / carboxylate-amine ligase